MKVDMVSPICSVYDTRLSFSVAVPDGGRVEIIVLSTRCNADEDDVIELRVDQQASNLIQFFGIHQRVTGPVRTSQASVNWTALLTSVQGREKKGKTGSEPEKKKKKPDQTEPEVEKESEPKKKKRGNPVLFALALRDLSQEGNHILDQTECFFLVSNASHRNKGRLVNWGRREC
jgi:hypothetical protein